MEITNRELASKLGFTLGQIKTWAVLVCGRDPQADQGGGVARKYDVDGAFKIFLCGTLIHDLRLGLKEAANFLNILWPHLERLKLLPRFHLEQRNYLRGCLGIDLFIYPKPEPHFEVRWRIAEEYGLDIKKTYRQEWIPQSNNPCGPFARYYSSSSTYRIELDYYLSTFLDIFS
jgi:hypothetical protein